MNLEALLRQARKHNARFDEIGRRDGQAPPQECGPSALLETAIAAINAGVMRDDWNCVAQGLVLLHQLRPKVRAR